VAVAQATPAAIADEAPDRADILRLAGLFSPEEVQLHYQIAIHGRNDLPYAPDERTGFVMTLLRMLSFRPVDNVEADNAAPRRAASQAEAPVPPSVLSRPPAASVPAAVPAAAAKPPASTAAAERSMPPLDDEPPVTGTFDGDWTAMIARLPLTGFVRTWANKSELAAFEGGEFRLRVGTKALAEDRPMQEKLRQALELYLGRPVRLAVQTGEMAGASVAALTEKRNDLRQKAAEASIGTDPFVREMMEKTGAQPTDIRPA
jgi:DNA polymerase-3 subunit gamma/tau